MKYRIIQHPNGKYRVQEKHNWLDDWTDCWAIPEDYASFCDYLKWNKSDDYNDSDNNLFINLEDSQRCLERKKSYYLKTIELKKQRKLMKKFKVIKKEDA